MEAEPDTPDVSESGVAARHRTLQLHVQQLTALGNKPELVELNMTTGCVTIVDFIFMDYLLKAVLRRLSYFFPKLFVQFVFFICLLVLG